MNDDGTSNTVYPTYRELAEKYGVAPSVIADYAKSHNTMHRRKYGEHRIEARSRREDHRGTRDRRGDHGRRDARAHRRVPHQVQEALKEGRVRTDSPADVNTLIRLKSFLRRRRLAAGDPPHARSRCCRRGTSATCATESRRPRWLASSMRGEVETEHGKSNSLGGVPVALPFDSGTARRNRTVPAPARRGAPPVNFARELAEQMGADPTTPS